MVFVFAGLVLADLAFLAVWLFAGYGVDGDAARALRHQVGGLMVCILTVFAHSVTFVYFLGTGLAVKEARRNWGISADWVRQTRRFKLQAYPAAMGAIGLIIAAGILGGAARSGSAPVAIHAVLAHAATAVSLVAFALALRLMLRNGWMMALIRGEIEAIREAAARGERVGAPGEATPELLKPPSEVKQAPSGFLAARACLFLAISIWVLFGYFWVQHAFNGKWAELGTVGWIPFALVSAPLFAAAIYLRIRHPLPDGIEF
jgi:hypothetical protein